MADAVRPLPETTLQAWDHYIEGNLHALPHLPPGSAFTLVDGPLVRELLEHVAATHGEAPGLRYLERACARDLALLTAALALDAVRSVTVAAGADLAVNARIRDVVGRGAMGDVAPTDVDALLSGERARHEPLVGELLGAPELLRSVSTKDWFDSVSAQSAGDVVAALALCRSASGFSAEANPAWSRGDAACRDTVLADLLRLSPSADPLEWIREHRLPECARLVAQEAVGRIFLAMRMKRLTARGPVPTSHDVHGSAKAGPLSVVVNGIDELPDSFGVRLRFRLRYPNRFRPSGDVPIGQPWLGFTRVRDDRGNAYLVQSGDGWWTGGWRRGSFRGELTMDCWPALTGATQLDLEDAPAALNVWQPCPVGHLHPAPGPVLGAIAVSIPMR